MQRQMRRNRPTVSSYIKKPRRARRGFFSSDLESLVLGEKFRDLGVQELLLSSVRAAITFPHQLLDLARKGVLLTHGFAGLLGDVVDFVARLHENSKPQVLKNDKYKDSGNSAPVPVLL
jgi:hypothetical protein